LKRIKGLVYLTVILFLVSGCTNNNTESKSIVLNIPNVDEYTFLYVQGVDKDGDIVPDEGASEGIKDDEKIKTFISKVDKLEAIKRPGKELTDKAKELNNPGNYMFILSDTEEMDNKAYSINFYKDGTMQFEDPDKNEIVYISTEKHPKLLKELKTLLEITY